MIITPNLMAGVALAAAITTAAAPADTNVTPDFEQPVAAAFVPFDDTRVAETVYDDAEEVVIHAVYRIPGSTADRAAKAGIL